MRIAIDGHGSFLHGLEQSRLGFGRRPVDFVREQKGREDRTANQRELIRLQVEHVRAGDRHLLLLVA